MSTTWGTAATMDPFEVMMWRVESDPMLSSTIVGIELLAAAPDPEHLRAAHQRLVDAVARLRKRVVEPPLGLGAPRWSPDPEFDLDRHLRREVLPDGAGWPELLDAAAQVAVAPFDRERPPWAAVLYEGLPDGRAAYLLKLHHASTDGLGIVQLLRTLHTTSPYAPAEPVAAADAGTVVSPLDALAGQVVDDVAAIPGLLRDAGGVVRSVLAQPAPVLRAGLRYGRSLRRVLSPPGAPPSPLLAGRGAPWRFAALDVAFADLRAAGKAVGASLNDVYLAALLGGYRHYHEAMGAPVDAIPMAIPISVRAAGDGGGGNRIASARFDGPVGVVDVRERVEIVAEIVRRARTEPALDNIAVVAPLLARLPGPVIGKLAGGLAKGNDLQASNVPGVREELFLAGVPVDRIYPFAPLPGCPAMITLVTHGDTCCVGVNYDPAAITDGELFERCLADGFTEVLALTPGAAAPVRRD